MLKNSIIFKNASYLVFRTLLISLIGLFTVRELLRLLGVESYGLFNLVFGIAALFTFINGAMVSSTQRYLSFYLGRKDDKKLNDVWNSSIILHLLIAITVSLILCFLKNPIFQSLLSIDSINRTTADFIFNLAIVHIFFTILQSPFNALILAKEKMSFYAMLSLYDAVSKLLIIYILYFLSDPLLEKYTILYVSSSLIVFFCYVFYCSKNFDKKLNFGTKNIALLKEMFFYSSWNMFGNFSSVTKIQGVNILINTMFGLVINSTYSITNTVVGVVSSLINSISTAINPQIYKSYAEEDYERNSFLISMGSKFSFFFCLLFVLPVLFNTQYLLELWLKEIPDHLIIFTQLALIVLLIDCLSGTLMTGIQATGKIKTYQIVVSIAVFMNLPLSYLMLQFIPKPWVIYWVAIVLSLLSLGLRLYFLRKLMKFDITVYTKLVLFKVALVVSMSIFLSWVFQRFIYTDNPIFLFLISSTTITLIVIVNIILLGLSVTERQFIQNKIKDYFK